MIGQSIYPFFVLSHADWLDISRGPGPRPSFRAPAEPKYDGQRDRYLRSVNHLTDAEIEALKDRPETRQQRRHRQRQQRKAAR